MNKKSRAAVDLTVGNPLKVIILFTIPIILGNLFQQLYNVVDTVIVGHILGEESLAAVGATSALYGFFTSTMFGFNNGFSVVIARYFGAKDEKRIKKAVAHVIMLASMIVAILTVVGMVFVKPLLRILQTPAEIIDKSIAYIGIILAFSVVTMFYNTLSAMLRGIGNSLIPVIFLVISASCNVGLDIVFIKYCNMGVAGASTATVISQLISVIGCYLYIVYKTPILHVKKEDFKWDKSVAEDLFSNGFSMALMFSIVSFGSIALQSAINTLGAVTIAAHTAARKMVEMFMMFISPFTTAAATFCGQNLGANKKDRIWKGIKSAFVVIFSVVILENIIVFFFAKPMIVNLTGSDNELLIATAVKYMRINLPFYFPLAVLLVLRSTLQGMNRKLIPLMASATEVIGKFIFAGILVPIFGYTGVCFAEPITWVIGGILVGTDFVIAARKLK